MTQHFEFEAGHDDQGIDMIIQCLDIFLNVLENKFLEHRKHHSSTWMKLDGNIVKIKDMNAQHIKNCIKMLENVNQTNLKAYKGLLRELKKRSIHVQEISQTQLQPCNVMSHLKEIDNGNTDKS